MSDEAHLASAALAGMMFTFRVLVNRGLVSPNEVETTYQAIELRLQNASPHVATVAQTEIATLFAELRQVSQERWIGRGSPDPEKLPTEPR